MKDISIIWEKSALICPSNQWTDFYIVGTSVMKVLMKISLPPLFCNTFAKRSHTHTHTHTHTHHTHTHAHTHTHTHTHTHFKIKNKVVEQLLVNPYCKQVPLYDDVCRYSPTIVGKKKHF